MTQVPEEQIAREFSFGCPYFEGVVEKHPKEVGILVMNCGMHGCGIDVITERVDDTEEFRSVENTGMCVAPEVVPFDLQYREPEHSII
jgi:hypothetical protein